MTMIQKTMDDICRLSGLAISSPLYDTVHLLLPGMYGTPWGSVIYIPTRSAISSEEQVPTLEH